MPLVLAWLTLMGCGDPLDPVAELRVERTMWPSPDDAAPNATLVAGTALGERLVAELVDGSNFASPPGPFGLRLIVLPTVGEASLHVDGREPLSVVLDVKGTADLRTGFGGPSDLPWVAGVRGDLALDATSDATGLHVGLALADPEALEVSVTLQGLDDGAGAMASGAAAGAIEGAIDNALAQPLRATLKPGPGLPRDLRPRAVAGGVALDLVLPAVGPTSMPAALPDPGDGFVIEVPLDTLLGVGKALASLQLTTSPAILEPMAVQARDGQLVVEGLAHKTSRRERWRRYEAVLDLGLADGHLVADLVQLELLEKYKWSGGAVAAIAESSAPNRLASLADQVRTTTAVAIGDKRQIEIELQRLEVLDDAVRLHGTARVTDRPDPPVAP